MPVKRRLSKQREHAIDHEALALFERGLQLHRRRHRSIEHGRDYTAAASRLDRALGIRLWQQPVLDCTNETKPPDWMDHELEISCWHSSKQIEQQLQQALAAQRARVGTVCPPSPPETVLS